MKFGEFEDKFRINELKVLESRCWIASVRPAQITLGALVISLKEPKTSLAQVTSDEGGDLFEIVQKVDALMREFCQHEKTNLLALMMVDPYVHFHFIPRYSEDKFFHGLRFTDSGWPGPPSLKAEPLSVGALEDIKTELRSIIRE